MLKKTYNKQTRIRKIITGMTGILFLFYAVSCGSEGDTSSPSPNNADSTPPSAVENLKVDSFTDTQAVLSWTAPTNTGTTDGTTPATLSSYVVKYKRTADDVFIEINETGEGVRLATALTGTSTNATVIGLDGNTSYTFLVVAVHSGDAAGPDEEALTIEQTTIPAPPGKFRLAQCSKATSLDLTWDTSTGATSYKLYRDEAEIASITTNFYPDTGLTAGTDYTYKVQSCTTAGCSGDSDPLTISTIDDQDKNLRNLIKSGRTPADLTGYDQRSREIFSRYSSDIPLVAKYLKPGGSGDGSSFADAEGNLKTVLDGITSAADKVYAVFLAGGEYKAGSSMAMKNHVAIIGGVSECLDSSDTVTALDGENSYGVFINNNLINTALLYGVAVVNGKANQGGGMYNNGSSPSLVGVTFSGNAADSDGGGMYNNGSSPSLVGVTFSGNTAVNGGGMYNTGEFPGYSSPILVGVTFFANTATNGGGMYNDNNGGVGPSIINGIFWGNTADAGPQFYFVNDSGDINKENLSIYNSIVSGGTGNLRSGDTHVLINDGGFFSGGGLAPVVISFSNIIDADPELGELANNGGSVWTHAIMSTSPAVNQGLYVRRNDNTFYYSEDSTAWYTNPDLSGTEVTVPTDAVDVTAIDATGYTRTNRPDLGAYEAR